VAKKRKRFGFGKSEAADEQYSEATEVVEEEENGFEEEESLLDEIESSVDRLDTEAAEWSQENAGSYEIEPKVFGPDTASAVDEAYEEENGETAVAKTLSLIAAETFIEGDIIADGHLEIRGNVKGAVRAKGNVVIQGGSVKGDVSGDKIGLYGCKVSGNLHAASGVVEDAGSVVVGDVETANVIVDGKLKGNIVAESVAVFRSNAYYIGDVVTGSLQVEAGAVVNGSIRTAVDGNPEDPFNL